MYHLERDFLNRHPDINLKCGRSSEDGKWWADVRVRRTGTFIDAVKDRPSLFDALSAVEIKCDNWYKSFYRPEWKKEQPRYRNYGLARDIEPEDDNDGE